jgi:PASTA domain-containing protein
MGGVTKTIVAVLVLLGVWVAWIRPTEDHRLVSDASGSPSPTAAPARALVVVPRLIGVHDSFARHLLELTHLRPGRVRLVSSEEPWGSVLNQSIAPGVEVRPGTRVGLVLAKGSAPEPCRLYWCATSFGRALGEANASGSPPI